MIHFEREEGSEIRVPRAALMAMAGLVVATMALAGAGRLTGAGTVGHPQVMAEAVPLRNVAFLGAPDGPVRVVDADNGEVLQVLEPGEGGFLRGVLRPLERERMRQGAPMDAPYALHMNGDGSLALHDPGTGVTVDIAAFGQSSVRAFLELTRPGVSGP